VASFLLNLRGGIADAIGMLLPVQPVSNAERQRKFRESHPGYFAKYRVSTKQVRAEVRARLAQLLRDEAAAKAAAEAEKKAAEQLPGAGAGARPLLLPAPLPGARPLLMLPAPVVVVTMPATPAPPASPALAERRATPAAVPPVLFS
jgi:hypothetical protein